MTAPTSDDDARDRQFMQIALGLARRGLGTTAPNPSVGAVVVDAATGEVIARGWTQPGGRPHAETEALIRAGARARGATMYVTLEPCSHYGKTPPCADAIVQAGLARVVVGIEDPDPRVAGRGLNMLRTAGIAVRRRVCADEAHWITRGHIARVTERRPFVQIKMALDRDGSVPRGGQGRPRWATGALARAHGHLLRARTDAILVGSGTVEDDDPELTCRLPGMLDRSPVRVVLCGCRLPRLDSKLVRTANLQPVWLFCGPLCDPMQQAELRAAGCRVWDITTVGGQPWVPAVTEALVAEGITRLLVEGGPSVWGSFFSVGLVDEVVQYRAGADRPHAVREEAAVNQIDTLAGHMSFKLAGARQLGDDDMFIFHRTRGR